MHRAIDNLPLQARRQIDEVGAVAAHPNQKILVILGMLLRVHQLFTAVDVELDVPAVSLHERLDEPGHLLKFFVIIQYIFRKFHIHEMLQSKHHIVRQKGYLGKSQLCRGYA